jgi:hypothetical protein
MKDIKDIEEEANELGTKVRRLPLPKRVRFLSLDELERMSRPRPLISGALYSNMEHVLFGAQGTTKTFLAIDMALHMAYQRRWMGLPVEHARVVYICGEGGGVMFADRINAWLQYHEISDRTAANELLRVTEQPVPLMDEEWLAALILDIERDGGAHFVVIDTLAANFGGGDENSQADMGIFCNAMRRIRLRTGAGVMVIHHTGHADRTRPQGANILRRNVDIELRVDRDSQDDSLFGLIGGGELKSRHGKGCGMIPYRLENVRLSEADALGYPIDSAVIVPSQDVPAFEGQRASTAHLGKNQRLGLEILRQLAATTGQDLHGPEGVYVSSVDWSAACTDAGLAKQRRSEVRNAFEKRGWITEAVGGFKWFPE